SVYNGLVAASGTVEADDWVLVHDAARPCLPQDDLSNLLREGGKDAVGAILALPVAETVKSGASDENGVERIAATQDRTRLWLAQTPQMFRAGLLAQALGRTGVVTDEASAVEQLGLKPRLVVGSRENLKVTYPEDVRIAAAILAMRA
ncbi:MAG TPA: 2-C-methyl-D-erythritol 4-phosphate cytidylyltransferase, partial [Burkholderiales bacterium]